MEVQQDEGPHRVFSAALKKDNGELTSSDQETVEVLGQYFKDVFTAEETKDVPVETEKELDWEDTSVDFSVESIVKKLQKLPTDKSPGPDGIHYLPVASRPLGQVGPWPDLKYAKSGQVGPDQDWSGHARFIF